MIEISVNFSPKMSSAEYPKSPVAGAIASFDKGGLKRAETAEKNPLPSSDGKATQPLSRRSSNVGMRSFTGCASFQSVMIDARHRSNLPLSLVFEIMHPHTIHYVNIHPAHYSLREHSSSTLFTT